MRSPLLRLLSQERSRMSHLILSLIGKYTTDGYIKRQSTEFRCTYYLHEHQKWLSQTCLTVIWPFGLTRSHCCIANYDLHTKNCLLYYGDHTVCVCFPLCKTFFSVFLPPIYILEDGKIGFCEKMARPERSTWLWSQKAGKNGELKVKKSSHFWQNNNALWYKIL